MFNKIQPYEKERIQKATWLLRQIGCSGDEYAELVKQFQQSYGLKVDGIFGKDTYNKLFYVLLNIKKLPVTYTKTPNKRTVSVKRVCLHYTCAHNVSGSIGHWNTKGYAGGTPFVIDRAGGVYIVYDYNNGYSYHMGLHTSSAYQRDTYECATLGIELCNAGFTTKKNNLFVNPLGVVSNNQDVVQLPKAHKGELHYEEYTDEQLLALKRLLVLLSLEFGFSISDFDTANLFDFDPKWHTRRKDGIITHCVVNPQKYDLAPTPKILAFLDDIKRVGEGDGE
jgi:hypothetical protein